MGRHTPHHDWLRPDYRSHVVALDASPTMAVAKLQVTERSPASGKGSNP
jgi:hypothetical protein